MTEARLGGSDVRRPPWDVGDLVKAIVLSVGFVVVAVAVILALGFVLRLAGLSPKVNQTVITIVLLVVQNGAFLLAIWVFGLRKHKVGIDRLGLQPYSVASGCSLALMGMVASLGFNFVYSVQVSSSLGRQPQQPPVLPLFGGGLLGFALALLVASLIVPLVEETFFRGFLFPGLAGRFGLIGGVLLSAIIFGAAHTSVDTFIPLSFFGVVLAVLYSITGSIYPGIMLHSVNNTLALLAAYVLAGRLNLPR